MAANHSFTHTEPQRHHRRTWLRLVIAAVLLLVAILFFLGVGRWLVVEDPLEKVQAVAVLSGKIPVRAIEAARLYREGYAQEIWLTRSAQPAAALAAMDIPYVGEDFYNLRVLIHEGVPADAIRVLQPPIANTADEVAAISAFLEGENGNSVIIVTTKAHTRRVRTLWHRLAGAKKRAIVRAAADDPFDPAHWWRSSDGALDVVRELLGLLNAWTGLPIRPAK
jgi:uncharacterized SAM-binding protein YcdF (DUF218 family)